VLAGPTCDSADILYEKTEYKLPLSLKPGDKVEILSTGAYTTTYSSVRVQRLRAAEGDLHLALLHTETNDGALRKAPSPFIDHSRDGRGHEWRRKSKKKASRSTLAFAGRMVMIGFGSIGQGVLPLIFRHIDIKPEQITVISPRTAAA
jgi:hypothetical protein